MQVVCGRRTDPQILSTQLTHRKGLFLTTVILLMIR